MDKTTSSGGNSEETIIKAQPGHSKTIFRVSALASSPNQVYVGSTGGEIAVLSRVTGERLDRSWDAEKRCIEGVMFDYEGKLVYATEMNLVMIDKEFNRKIKEYRSFFLYNNAFRRYFFSFWNINLVQCKSFQKRSLLLCKLFLFMNYQ